MIFEIEELQSICFHQFTSNSLLDTNLHLSELNFEIMFYNIDSLPMIFCYVRECYNFRHRTDITIQTHMIERFSIEIMSQKQIIREGILHRKPH